MSRIIRISVEDREGNTIGGITITNTTHGKLFTHNYSIADVYEDDEVTEIRIQQESPYSTTILRNLEGAE